MGGLFNIERYHPVYTVGGINPLPVRDVRPAALLIAIDGNIIGAVDFRVVQIDAELRAADDDRVTAGTRIDNQIGVWTQVHSV